MSHAWLARPLPFAIAAASLLMAAGCLKPAETAVLERRDDRQLEDDEPEPGGSSNPDTPPPWNGGGPGSNPSTPGTPARGVCVNGGACTALAPEQDPRLDLLFVIDNAGMMQEEQQALSDQFPSLLSQLTTGKLPNGKTIPRVRDIHLGVVSTDMGLVGIPNDYPGCNTGRHFEGGDDGRLLHPGGGGPGCADLYPRFLSHLSEVDELQKTAADLHCISMLGTNGCGFEQPLESALKALWPKNYVGSDGTVYPPQMNPVLFLSTTPENQFGRGDVPQVLGGNDGFLRRHPTQGISHLAIVVLTDEEDCSSKNTAHFIASDDPNNPLSVQGINLRCFYNKQNLFEVERYVKAFEALRPNYPDKVSFAAIVGVPAELVSEEARAQVNFENEVEREAYYERILDDPRMIERPLNEDVPAIANVAPSCTRVDGNGERDDAYPPRRIVEVARGFGERGLVQSICEDDYGPAIDAIVKQIVRQFDDECLDLTLVRGHDGKVKCDVIWELPPPNAVSSEDTPVRCEERPFLRNVESPRSKTSARGGRNCKVTQRPVTNLSEVPAGEGFFYDDYTEAQESACGARSRIAFSEGAAIPPGVRAYLDCLKDAD